MIRRVRIRNYKSFKDLTLTLRPLTVIFGPNGSGKSNLLDALYLLSRAVTRRNFQEAFEGHRGLPLESFYYGEAGFDALMRQETVSFSFDVDVELSDPIIARVEEVVRQKRRGIEAAVSAKTLIAERYLRYHLTVQALPDAGFVRVMDERLCAIKRNGEEKKSRKPFLERQQNSIHLRMEGQGHPTYYDVGLDHTVISTALYEPHCPHIVAFKMELANWHTYYLEPRMLMRQDVPVGEIETMGARGENLAAFLNTLRLRYPKAYDSLVLSLGAILPTTPTVQVVHTREGLVEAQLCENGVCYSARLISEGTLRILGLLGAIHPKTPSTVVAFEEPENGVHPARLRTVGDLLRNAVEVYGKQIIVTTHSPVLPEYFGDADLFVSARSGSQTTVAPFRTWGPLFRRQDIDHALEDRLVRGEFGG